MKNQEIAVITRRMFDIRNNLVHPKAKEGPSEDVNNIVTGLSQFDKMESVVQDMKSFFNFLLKVTPTQNF